MTREEAKKMFREDRDAYGKPKAIMHKIDQIFNEFEKDNADKGQVVEKFCTLRCKTCEHWKQTSNWQYEGATNTGKCRELPNDNLAVELHTGWDGGYVDYIETEEIFGCTEHSEYKKEKK
jgi:hypothetical protein